MRTRPKSHPRRAAAAQPAVGPAGSDGWGKREGVLAALLAGATLLAFSPALWCGFVNFDDPVYVTSNPQVQAGLTAAGCRWACGAVVAANWHPLTLLSLMLDAQLFGGRPWGYHLTSLLLHAANAVLLFAFLRQTTGATWRSLLAAALFALHPLRVESVAWVSERKDVLSTFFGLLALLAYAGYARSPSALRYLAVSLAFAASLLTKPMLVTLPCLLLLLDYWPLGRWQRGPGGPGKASLRRLLLEKLPLLALSAASCAATLWAQHQGEAIATLARVAPGERIANALFSYLHYLRQAVLPTDLAAFYPHPNVSFGLGAVLAGAVLAGATALTLRWGRCCPYLPLGWLWYLGTLVPVIGLIQVGAQARADRYTYFPFIGLSVAVAWGGADLARRWRRERELAAAAGLALAGLALAAWAQTRVWRDSVTLWKHAVRVTGGSWMAYNLLTDAWKEQGDQTEAVRFLRDALDRSPKDGDIHYNLGLLLLDLGNGPDAARHFQEALRLDPQHPMAHYHLGLLLFQSGQPTETADHCREALRQLDPDTDPQHPQAPYCRWRAGQIHNLLGLALLRLGAPDEAEEHFKHALELNPEAAPLHYNLGLALQAQGRWPEAADCFRRCAEIQPGATKYHRALAFALSGAGRTDEAREEYRHSLRLDPSWPGKALRSAWLLATHPDPRRRNGRQALADAQQVSQAIGENDPQVLDTLAAAYAALGRFPQAAAAARQAKTRAAAAGQSALAREIGKRLSRYERGAGLE